MEEEITKNKLVVIDAEGNIHEDRTVEGLDVEFRTAYSMVVIHEPIHFENCHILAESNSYVEIFPSTYEIVNLQISAKNHSEVIIQENFACREALIENHDEPNLKVSIGKDCMFSYGIIIRVSDGHTIFSTEDSSILNRPKVGVTIGDHVWVGMRASILKDVTIPNNTIIGAGSLVNKSFTEENTIIAGTPAKVIKKNVNWHHLHTDFFK